MTAIVPTSAELARAIADIDGELELLAAERKVKLGILLARTRDAIVAALRKNDKDHGKVTVQSDGFELHADIRQTVKWDQAKLTAAASLCDSEEAARHILKVDVSVEEKTYKALPPGPLKDALTAARTTKLSEPSIKVVFPKGA